MQDMTTVVFGKVIHFYSSSKMSHTKAVIALTKLWGAEHTLYNHGLNYSITVEGQDIWWDQILPFLSKITSAAKRFSFSCDDEDENQFHVFVDRWVQ